MRRHEALIRRIYLMRQMEGGVSDDHMVQVIDYKDAAIQTSLIRDDRLARRHAELLAQRGVNPTIRERAQKWSVDKQFWKNRKRVNLYLPARNSDTRAVLLDKIYGMTDETSPRKKGRYKGKPGPDEIFMFEENNPPVVNDLFFAPLLSALEAASAKRKSLCAHLSSTRGMLKWSSCSIMISSSNDPCVLRGDRWTPVGTASRDLNC